MSKKVYTATTHGYSEVIVTPQRHALNPSHLGLPDWHIVESQFSEKGVKLIWSCEISSAPPSVKAPSKFHPHAGKKKAPKKKPAKKAKPEPAKAAKPSPKPAPAQAKPANGHAPKAQKPASAPETAAPAK